MGLNLSGFSAPLSHRLGQFSRCVMGGSSLDFRILVFTHQYDGCGDT